MFFWGGVCFVFLLFSSVRDSIPNIRSDTLPTFSGQSIRAEEQKGVAELSGSGTIPINMEYVPTHRNTRNRNVPVEHKRGNVAINDNGKYWFIYKLELRPAVKR